MKKITVLLLIIVTLLAFVGCDKKTTEKDQEPQQEKEIQITLSDSDILVDGNPALEDASQEVYIAHDIVYYEDGRDFTYGEGEERDAHSKEEAAAHTVVHITKAGRYVLSGKLSAGQIAVDLGDDAKKDESAVVTLVLNGVDINCTVAPAVIFYNVYECGDKDTQNATKDVDTINAGANVIIADNTVNNVSGSYVARIYDPETVVLSEDGTQVDDADKLHKYDAAFYSKRTMNVSGGKENSGVLNITADNEGLDSELHLTINGGNINIVSGNDGINTNEDGVSVTTINGGSLNILVNGITGEGDGIDSNGWLVINGGTVTAEACAFSGDAGIDSDMGIHINGGTVIASGNMLDRISEGRQTYAVFTFSKSQTNGTFTLKNANGDTIAQKQIENSFKYLIISDPTLVEGNYTLWHNETQFEGVKTHNGGQGGFMGGGMRPDEQGENMTPPEGFNGARPERPQGENMVPPEMPDGMTPPEGFENMPHRGEKPDVQLGGTMGEASKTFNITEGENYFVSVVISQ